MLGLFKETYPLYPQEPLLLLIKSGVFITKDYFGNEEYSVKNCNDKLALFVLLASKSESKELLECWSKFEYGNTVSKIKASGMIW